MGRMDSHTRRKLRVRVQEGNHIRNQENVKIIFFIILIIKDITPSGSALGAEPALRQNSSQSCALGRILMKGFSSKAQTTGLQASLRRSFYF